MSPQSANEELERLRDSSKTSALVRSLRNQLEEQQASTQGTVKSLKRVQEELDESVVQVEELTRAKHEVCYTPLSPSLPPSLPPSHPPTLPLSLIHVHCLSPLVCTHTHAVGVTGVRAHQRQV